MAPETGSTAVGKSATTPKKSKSSAKAKPVSSAKKAVVKKSPASATSKSAAAPVKTQSSSHPTYAVMVLEAIKSLKERNGSSRQAILKYIGQNFKVGSTDDKHIQSQLKLALKRGVTSGSLKQSSGSGAAGSFKVRNLSLRLVKCKRSSKKLGMSHDYFKNSDVKIVLCSEVVVEFLI
jgi:hypothetical protein